MASALLLFFFLFEDKRFKTGFFLYRNIYFLLRKINLHLSLIKYRPVKSTYALIIIWLFLLNPLCFSQNECDEMNPDSIQNLVRRVNHYFLQNAWMNADRNWKRGTYYTGLMACAEAMHDPSFFDQALRWGEKHAWRIGTEWMYPANRMTCVQSYLQLYKKAKNPDMIRRAREVMDSKIDFTEPASEQGWDYVDALYVGTPAYMMMTEVTGEPVYADYANNMYWDVYADLFDENENLFYRDKKAMGEKSNHGKKVIWSRGNGWAMAAIPRIVITMDDETAQAQKYIRLLQSMSESLLNRQGADGFWRCNLADPLDYPNPESSGTAFFTYAMAWGINRGYLDRDKFLPCVEKAWTALYHAVDENGRVCWGQGVARGPGRVSKTDSREYVAGAFLLAARDILKLEIVRPSK